jgi:hypothetical protein
LKRPLQNSLPVLPPGFVLSAKLRRAGKRATQTVGQGVKGGGLDKVKSVIKDAKPVGDRLETLLDDGSKVIIRKDFGSKAHSIGKKYPKPVDHYNFEIQVKTPRGKWKVKKNYHFIMDKNKQLIEFFD